MSAGAIAALAAALDDEDPYSYDLAAVQPLQVHAAAERFERARTEVPILDRRAQALGLERIARLDELANLLFAHTIYKTYPDSFVEEGRWRDLGTWFDAVSTRRGAAEFDVGGVADVDEWLARLHEHGRFAFTSSGTTGKCSFLDQTLADRELTRQTQVLNMAWSTGIVPRGDRPVFILGPSRGFHRFVDAFAAVADAFGRTGDVHYLSDEPLRVAEVNRLGRLQRAMAEGLASPSDVANLESAAAERQRVMHDALLGLVDRILQMRDEPSILMGMWSQHYAIAETARARGIPDGSFHSETAVIVGGGTKGARLPDDYEVQVARFYGIDRARFQRTYGMTEMSTTFPACRAGRYHAPPWIAVLVLDDRGECLVAPRAGILEGRMAFFDTTIEGRWGGLISGDRVTVEIGECACGRRGVVVTGISRFSDVGDDDKLTCAGTMESYVRGIVDP